MQITSTEFKLNLGRYLDLVSSEEIHITKNGRRIAKLVSDEEDLVSIAKSLFGIIPSDATLEDTRKERLSRYERND